MIKIGLFYYYKKGFYPYEYIDHWEKLSDMLLPAKDDFHSDLNIEHITGAD